MINSGASLLQSMHLVDSFEAGFENLEKVIEDRTALKHLKLMLKMQGVRGETIEKLCSFTGFEKSTELSFLDGNEKPTTSFITVKSQEKLPLEQTDFVTFVLAEQTGYLIDMNALTLVC